MKKITKCLLVIIMLGLIGVFAYLSKDWFGSDGYFEMKNIMVGTDTLSLQVKQIIVIGFLIVMLCVPVCLTESKWAPWAWCIIVLIGTIIKGEDFWGYLIVVLSAGGCLFGAIAQGIGIVIKLFFAEFNPVWLIRVFQMLGDMGIIYVISYWKEFLKSCQEDSARTNYNYSYGNEKSFTQELIDEYDKIMKEKREEETLEKLKDIDWRLKNMK